jgi:hypothetical protein
MALPIPVEAPVKKICMSNNAAAICDVHGKIAAVERFSFSSISAVTAQRMMCCADHPLPAWIFQAVNRRTRLPELSAFNAGNIFFRYVKPLGHFYRVDLYMGTGFRQKITF